MNRVIYYLTVFAAIAATAVSEYRARGTGQQIEQQKQLADASRRLDVVPSLFGKWRLDGKQTLPKAVIDMLKCAGYTARTYRHEDSGEAVAMILLVGEAGPLVAHTPEVCMASRDLRRVGDPSSFNLPSRGGGSHALTELTLQSQSVMGGRLRVYYAWNRGDRWEAPKRPRITLGGAPVLYKLQIMANLVPGSAGATENDAARQFLKELLPALDRTLFTASRNS